MAEPASRNPKSRSCGIVSANVPKRLPGGFDDCSQINKIERLVGSATIPTVPMYGGDEEFSLHQRQQSYLPRQTGWLPAAPRGLRPIGGNVFGGFGAQPPWIQDRWGRRRLQRHPRSAAAMVLVRVGVEWRQVTPCGFLANCASEANSAARGAPNSV